jgi:hypothetical protein
MRYVVLSAASAAGLAVEVTKALNAGWKLEGGVCVIVDGRSPTGHVFLQALSK